MRTLTKEFRAELTPADMLRVLLAGNARFAANLKANRDFQQQVQATANGQFPGAVILSCMDSRTGVELVFDQGLGDLFSIRVAGNVVSQDVLGSIEYAVAAAGDKLVMVLGHTACGAVTGACDKVRMGNLTGTLDRIQPAIARVPCGTGDPATYKDRVAAANVCVSIDDIITQSPIVRERLASGEVGLAGAMYNVSTGKVDVINACAFVREAVPAAEALHI
ncbi:MAG TPA: carbonic anhydrase family protein [Flavobacteriales bacterium]|nr:carbonic anhydrase family protein [Flavobacteriales bacterium]